MSRFWTVPATKELLRQEVQSSNVLQALWARNPAQNVDINANSTLPSPIQSKEQINQQVQLEYPEKQGMSLKWKQTTVYTKALVKFYKTGAVNVWKNYSQYRQLKSEFLIDNQVSNKGATVATKVSNFPKLVHEMSQAIYMSRVENKAFVENTNSERDVINHEKKVLQTVDPHLFTLTRSQFQLIRRTPKDIKKLPGFALVFAIFMEMTPILCYWFPQITPSTCILPNLMPRVWDAKNGQKVAEATSKKLQDTTKESLASLTAYNLDIEILRPLARALNLVSKYVPISWYPELVLRGKLQDHYNYLMVDNYYLSGLNGNGSVWDLSPQELVLACLERNLMGRMSAKTMEELIKEENHDLLRAELVRFLVDFEKFSVGYLCVEMDEPASVEIVKRD